MKRDSIKTAVGLVIIAGIVVATFLYGNAQRQTQIRHDQDVKNQQAKATAALPAASTSASAKPSAKPSATPAAKLAVTDGAASPSVIPDTGPTENGLVGLAAIVFATVLWRKSRAGVLKTVSVRE